MKKIIIATAMFIITANTFGQSEKYLAAMKKNIAMIDSGYSNAAIFLMLSNNFERIGNAEKSQWLPYYYAAYCQVNYAFAEKTKSKIDGLADKATELLNKADSLQSGNSEISCIKSMIASCHMMVDPMTRWAQYGNEITENMVKAMEQDATNPRPYLLKGQNLKYTPVQFGGGCKTAKPELQTALVKFGAFVPTSELHPVWGKPYTEIMMKECN